MKVGSTHAVGTGVGMKDGWRRAVRTLVGMQAGSRKLKEQGRV